MATSNRIADASRRHHLTVIRGGLARQEPRSDELGTEQRSALAGISRALERHVPRLAGTAFHRPLERAAATIALVLPNVPEADDPEHDAWSAVLSGVEAALDTPGISIGTRKDLLRCRRLAREILGREMELA